MAHQDLAWFPGLFAGPEKVVWSNSCLPQNCPESAFWQIARMIGDCGVAARIRVVPDFVTAGGLPVESEAELLEALDDLPLAKAGQPAH